MDYDKERRQLEAHKNGALLQLQMEQRDEMTRMLERHRKARERMKDDYDSRVVTLRVMLGRDKVVEGESGPRVEYVA